MSIGSRIRELRIKNGITQEDLAKTIGVTKGAIANYENEVSSPKIDLMYKLFDALDCDANYLYQDDMKELYKDKSTPEEFEKIIKKYRSLDPYGQETVNITLDREVGRIKKYGSLSETPAAVIDLSVRQRGAERLVEYFHSASAGSGIFILGNEIADQIPIPDTPENREVDYAIKVSGESMSPDFHDADIALVSQRKEMSLGDIGIFVKNGDVYIKELGRDELISRNDEFDNIPVSDLDNIVCMGKVIGKL